MMNSQSWEDMRKEYEQNDSRREQLIRVSREAIRLSKEVINSVHRLELEKASTLMQSLREKMKSVEEFSDYLQLDSGSYKAAMQEYVEAACLEEYAAKGTIPSPKELGVESDHYLLGICDLCGELGRRAVNSAIAKNPAEVLRIKKVVEELYAELIMFDFRNGELRKKFDSVKYSLKRLEDISLQVSL